MKAQKKSANVPVHQRASNTLDAKQASRQAVVRSSLVRALRRNRGTGPIYDVIDEWLAPLFARVIAQQQRTQANTDSRK